MSDKSYLERLAELPVEQRDREFYLLALPLAMAVISLAPHVLMLAVVPNDIAGFFKLTVEILAGSIIIGLMFYAMTRLLSRPKWWGAQRHRWPVIKHFLLLFIPMALLVDAPTRLAEVAMIGSKPLPTAKLAAFIIGISTGRAILFAVGVVFYERLIGAARESADYQQKALRLETLTLKNMIQPHFLLNSLNVVRAYVEESPKTAEEMLLNLTSLLRRVIQYSSKDKITLEEEIGAVTDYVKVMNQRFEADFRLCVEGARNTAITIPPLVIFSLVENSFKHGFAGKKQGAVTISMETGDKIRFIVKDDGTPGVNTDTSGGLGEQYIRSRLELAYGSDFAFRHGGNESGYEAVIEIPWRNL